MSCYQLHSTLREEVVITKIPSPKCTVSQVTTNGPIRAWLAMKTSKLLTSQLEATSEKIGTSYSRNRNLYLSRAKRKSPIDKVWKPCLSWASVPPLAIQTDSNQGAISKELSRLVMDRERTRYQDGIIIIHMRSC